MRASSSCALSARSVVSTTTHCHLLHALHWSQNLPWPSPRPIKRVRLQCLQAKSVTVRIPSLSASLSVSASGHIQGARLLFQEHKQNPIHNGVGSQKSSRGQRRTPTALVPAPAAHLEHQPRLAEPIYRTPGKVNRFSIHTHHVLTHQLAPLRVRRPHRPGRDHGEAEAASKA
jgi:hypothetical protein